MNVLPIIRTNARNNRTTIIQHLQTYYLNRENGSAKVRPAQEICSFCGANKNITYEHVLPRWVFGKDPNLFFNTTINGLSHKYGQTVVPACQNCNNVLLSTIEKKVLHLFIQHQQKKNFFNIEEAGDIIRWLELLDYKYQVFSLRTRFWAIKGKGRIPFLTDYPISVVDPNIDYAPSKVMSNLRQALFRITVKSKQKMLNSLVTFKTKNPDIHFFHKNNDFIFLELPKYNLSLLYFYQQTFSDVCEAKDTALATVKEHY